MSNVVAVVILLSVKILRSKRYDDVKILRRSMEKEVWKIFDKHNKGFTTLKEIYRFFGEDIEDDTIVTYEDLEAVLNDPVPEEEYLNAFNFFDTTKSGKISRHDIKKTMKLLGESLTNEELTEMFSELGFDNKEFLTYEEFKELSR